MTVWVSTFLTVVIVDIDIGLLTGILVSLFALYLKVCENLLLVVTSRGDNSIHSPSVVNGISLRQELFH